MSSLIGAKISLPFEMRDGSGDKSVFHFDFVQHVYHLQADILVLVLLPTFPHLSLQPIVWQHGTSSLFCWAPERTDEK